MENDENIQSSNKLIVNMSLYMRGVKINNLSVINSSMLPCYINKPGTKHEL
jgi:hypothetical protein